MKLAKLFLFWVIVGATPIFVCAQDQKDHNFGLERTQKFTAVPDQWIAWGQSKWITADSTTVHSGKRSVHISWSPAAGDQFGCVAHRIADTFDAKEVEVRAYIKMKNVHDGEIGLLVRIDGPLGEMLAIDNMKQRNIAGTKDWTMYSVTLPYPDEAYVLYVGALLGGKGEMWVDDFEVLLDGKNISEAKLSVPKVYKATTDKEFDSGSKISGVELNKSKQEDLAVLGKIWGFLKYYHPTIAAGEINWDSELFRVLPKILSAASSAERNRILNTWVTGLGTIEKSAQKDPVVKEIKLKPDHSWMNVATLGNDLAASLQGVLNAKRTGKHYYVGMTMGAGNPEFRNEKPYGFSSYPDQGLRLLSLYRYWSMIQYFFPYKNLLDDNWNDLLYEYIPSFVNASNSLEYKLATLSLIARVHDTHANIWGGDGDIMAYKGARLAPVAVTFVENKAVITSFRDKQLAAETKTEIGDVIEEINGKSVTEIVKNRLELTPASNYATQLRDIAPGLLRTNDTILNIVYRRKGRLHSTTMRTYGLDKINPYPKTQKPDTSFAVIGSDIAYIYPGLLKNQHLPLIMPRLKQTKGLIIDFRCYPADFTVFTLSEYLQPKKTPFVKFSRGSVAEPGLFEMNEPLSVGEANDDSYKGKIVILVNEQTQSSAEYHTMAFRTAPGAVVVGSTTAGADGNISRIVLPGGINTMISGIGVYYPDGTETQRVGIVPDVEAKPTILGTKEGKDEVLEKAISIINNKTLTGRPGVK